MSSQDHWLLSRSAMKKYCAQIRFQKASPTVYLHTVHPNKNLRPWKTEVTISIQLVKVSNFEKRTNVTVQQTLQNHVVQREEPHETIWTVWNHVIVAKLLTSWLCEGTWRDYHKCDHVWDKPVHDFFTPKITCASLFRLQPLDGWGQNIPNSTKWCWRPGQRSPSPPRHTSRNHSFPSFQCWNKFAGSELSKFWI